MQFISKEIATAGDQRAAILEAVAGKLDGLDVMRNRVLVATYVMPEKTSGGIIRIDKTRDEGRFQGKAGLILKKGPAAFKFDTPMDKDYPSVEPAVGDWVFYRAADTWECGLVGLYCRFIYDDMIVGRISNPEMVW